MNVPVGRWLRRLFDESDDGVFVDSRRMRAFYAEADDWVQRHYEASIETDLLAILPSATSPREDWGW